jgi:membrane fusion protein (multidrug efflux system)
MALRGIHAGRVRALVTLSIAAALAACNRHPPALPPAAPQAVTTLTVAARDVPVNAEFVAQTQSSQAVNIQARVSGFLDKRVYTEGAVVKAGQVLFRMDPKPFQAQVDAARAALQRNQAALQVAQANLARTKPLAEQNALSQKDLDDATGQAEQAAAAVAQANAQLEEAELNLSYTTITSPVDGVSSFAAVAEGTYVSPQNAQLTTVSVLTPMWVNFSLSENAMERIRHDAATGRLRMPPTNAFDAEIELVDGAIFPYTGRITFADPSYNSQTGTFLIRVSVPNPQGVLRPNQYVRVRLKGAVRPNAILVPQRAVQQSAKGHFVWIVGKDGKAEMRPVDVGDWNGDDWFVDQGLESGDTVIVDGTLRLQPGAAVTATPYVAPPRPPPRRAVAAAAPGTALPSAVSASAATPIRFAVGSAALDATATQAVKSLATNLAATTARVAVTGYTDRTGAHDKNVALAKARAQAVRDALVAAGLAASRIDLRAPADVTGSGADDAARRVDVTIEG